MLHATGPHVLLAGVHTLALETDYDAQRWSLRMPYDNFVLTLARSAGRRRRAVRAAPRRRPACCSRPGGTLFTNRALGDDDNARLMSNIVSVGVARDGVVLFDDLRQGLSASYDPARFYSDARLLKTMFILLGLWLVWVVGSTRLRAPAIVGARSFRSRAGAARRRADRAHRGAVARGAGAVRPLLHAAWRARRAASALAPTERGELWTLAGAARGHPAAGARPAQRLVRRRACHAQACRWCRCRIFSINWNDG